MKTKKIYALLFAAIATLTVGCGSSEQSEEPAESQPKEVATNQQTYVIRKSDLKLQKVSNQEVSSVDLISGRVIPKTSTTLLAEVQGRVQQGTRPYKAGTYFRKGEVLMQVDSKEFALNLEAQKSAFLNILTGIMPDLKADYPDNYKQWLTYVSQYESNKPLPPLPVTQSASEKYYITANQVYSTYYSLKAQEERLEKYVIRAPYDGILTNALVDLGGLVSPGQPLGTFISNMSYEIEAAVSLRTANRLKIGDTIEFYSTNLTGAFPARVVRINNIIDAQTQNIPVYLTITHPQIKSGIYLEGRVQSTSYTDATTIASDLLLRDQNVLVLQDDIITKREVKVLETKMDSLIVSGLEGNELLVLNSFQVPVEGLKITQ